MTLLEALMIGIAAFVIGGSCGAIVMAFFGAYSRDDFEREE